MTLILANSMRKKCVLLFTILLSAFAVFSQGKFTLQGVDSDKIYFKLINNLIVIPVEVNGVELSFLLDTGVSKPILFNFSGVTDELLVNEAQTISLRGLGDGDSVEAIRSTGNTFKIGKAVNFNQALFAIFDSNMDFAPRLGLPVHGIIGYDILKEFVVEINYSRNFIRLYKPEAYKYENCKTCVTKDLSFINSKPYIETKVSFDGEKNIPVKLLIDSGGSDALWLFEDEKKDIHTPEKYFDDFLGKGLSGSVYGKRSRVASYSIGKFKLKNVKAAFPDSTSVSHARQIKDRCGSVSGEILKRFNLILDYPSSKITLKKNKNFHLPFLYNGSGITLEHNGVRVVKELDKSTKADPYSTGNGQNSSNPTIILSATYKYSLAPSFTIVELRKDSPAHRAGLMLGDIVLNVNHKHAHEYSLQDLIQIFYGKEGKRIRLMVDRNGHQMVFYFKLENLL